MKFVPVDNNLFPIEIALVTPAGKQLGENNKKKILVTFLPIDMHYHSITSCKYFIRKISIMAISERK